MMDCRKLISILTTRCPICRVRYGRRTLRRSNDRWLSVLFLYPFECSSCNHRFHAFAFSRPAPPDHSSHSHVP